MEYKVIRANIEKIHSNDEVKWMESMAGNAGYQNGMPCLATNFYCDPKNGMIICFGNCQSIPKSIKTRFKQCTFRIAVNLKTGVERIVNLFCGGINERARKNLEDTIRIENKYKLKVSAA